LRTTKGRGRHLVRSTHEGDEKGGIKSTKRGNSSFKGHLETITAKKKKGGHKCETRGMYLIRGRGGRKSSEKT